MEGPIGTWCKLHKEIRSSEGAQNLREALGEERGHAAVGCDRAQLPVSHQIIAELPGEVEPFPLFFLGGGLQSFALSGAAALQSQLPLLLPRAEQPYHPAADQ